MDLFEDLFELLAFCAFILQEVCQLSNLMLLLLDFVLQIFVC